ncbi:hypothetical protein [Kribbella endophytica]
MSEKNWHHGNANMESEERRGWILGHFIEPADDVRSTKDVEVKWGTHPAGQQRPEWTAGDQRTTLLMLISGSFRLDLTEETITLDQPGDYVVWGPGIDHFWQAQTDSVVVTVRWPSLPN